MIQELVKEMIETSYNLKIDTPIRKARHIEARAMYYKLTREYSNKVGLYLSLNDIGKFANKDHACVINAINRLDGWLTYDKRIGDTYRSLQTKVNDALLGIDLGLDINSIEGIYEKKYNELRYEYNILSWKFNFLKKRLSIHEPNRISSSDFYEAEIINVDAIKEV